MLNTTSLALVMLAIPTRPAKQRHHRGRIDRHRSNDGRTFWLSLVVIGPLFPAVPLLTGEHAVREAKTTPCALVPLGAVVVVVPITLAGTAVLEPVRMLIVSAAPDRRKA